MVRPNKRRILLLSSWFYPDSKGGTEAYVFGLAKELLSLGYVVEIAAPSGNEEERHYDYEGIAVYRYPVSLNPTKSELLGFEEPRFFDMFEKIILNSKPDLAHFHSLSRGLGHEHIRFLKSQSLPVVHTVHLPDLTCIRGTMMRWGQEACDGEIREFRCASCYLHGRGLPKVPALAVSALSQLLHPFFSGTNGRLSTAFVLPRLLKSRREVNAATYKMTDRTVCLSKWQYDSLILNGVPESKLILCRHGLSHAQRFPKNNGSNADRTEVHVGYIGRFSPVKGVHILIEALKSLSSDTPLKLFVYGIANGEDERRYLTRLKRIAEGDKRVEFCGGVSDSNRAEVMSSIDIMAVPSIWMETGPLVVLEAFASGVPVIGSDLGGIAEHVKHGVNGILVEQGNVGRWRDALEKISVNSAILTELSSNIPRVRTTRVVAEEMSGVYESLLLN